MADQRKADPNQRLPSQEDVLIEDDPACPSIQHTPIIQPLAKLRAVARCVKFHDNPIYVPKLTSKQPGTLPGRAEQQPDVARSTLDQAEQFSDAQKSQPSQTEAHQRIHPCPPPKIDPPSPLPTPQQETGVKGDTSDLTKPRGAKTAQKNHPLTQEVDDTSSGKVCPHPATNTEYCVDVQTSGQVCTHPPVCTEDGYPTNPKKPQVDGCPSVKVHTCPDVQKTGILGS